MVRDLNNSTVTCYGNGEKNKDHLKEFKLNTSFFFPPVLVFNKRL